MPTPAELFNERLDRIETIPELFIKKVGASQQELFNELMVILGRLGLADGKIELTSANLIKIDTLMNEYYEVLKEGRYGNIVRDFIEEMDVQKGISSAYNTAEFGAFKVRTPNMVHNRSKRRATELLLGDDFKTQFINVIRDAVVSNVEGQATFKEMRTNLQVLFKDEQRLPVMQNWTNQVSRDIFSVSDRNYNNQVANELGLEFGEYTGGTVKDSRVFCVDRAGKYYHYKEVQSWASQTWQGKYRRTTEQNIIEWLGGYNCMHVFAWRSTINVPKEVIERNIVNGNYDPSDTERELLGIN